MDRSNAFKRYAESAAVAMAMAGSTSALAARFDVADGLLVDHMTGLTWQGLSATAGEPLPTTPNVGSWRVASANDLSALIGPLFDSYSVPAESYTALSFFAASMLPHQSCESGPGPCFTGWYSDPLGTPNAPATYDVAFYNFSAPANGVVSVQANTTLGTYTNDNCGPYLFCKAGYGLFTVKAVPELPEAALLVLGLGALASLSLCRMRRSTERRDRRTTSTVGIV